MKKLLVVLATLTTTVFASENINCYTNLIRNGNDSYAHKISVNEVDTGNTLESMSRIGITTLMRNSGCTTTIKKFKCGEAIRGNSLTEVCYAETYFGYFLVSKDYMENKNKIFNRMD